MRCVHVRVFLIIFDQSDFNEIKKENVKGEPATLSNIQIYIDSAHKKQIAKNLPNTNKKTV